MTWTSTASTDTAVDPIDPKSIRMVYMFGRITDRGIEWFSSCGVCDAMNVFPTYDQALDQVTEHAHCHYGGASE